MQVFSHTQTTTTTTTTTTKHPPPKKVLRVRAGFGFAVNRLTKHGATQSPPARRDGVTAPRPARARARAIERRCFPLRSSASPSTCMPHCCRRVCVCVRACHIPRRKASFCAFPWWPFKAIERRPPAHPRPRRRAGRLQPRCSSNPPTALWAHEGSQRALLSVLPRALTLSLSVSLSGQERTRKATAARPHHKPPPAHPLETVTRLRNAVLGHRKGGKGPRPTLARRQARCTAPCLPSLASRTSRPRPQGAHAARADGPPLRARATDSARRARRRAQGDVAGGRQGWRHGPWLGACGRMAGTAETRGRVSSWSQVIVPPADSLSLSLSSVVPRACPSPPFLQFSGGPRVRGAATH